LDRHQGEATASQLGWHPAEPSSYTVNLKENFIKKREKLQEGGLGQNPQKTKKKQQKKKRKKKQQTEEEKKKETPDYGNRERGNPLQSKKKSV